MTAPLTPFRVHFDAVAGKVPAPVLITAATPRAAETEALHRHPGRTVAKIKRDKSAPHREPVEGRGAAPAALFGQRLCACGYANHDLRKRCRSCGSDLPRPSGDASALSQTLGEAAPAAGVTADSPSASAAKLKDGLPSGLAGGPE